MDAPEHGIKAEPTANVDEEAEQEDVGVKQEEEQEGESVEGQNFDVQEIVGVKVFKNQIFFHVVWDVDQSKSWEPRNHFPGGLQHERILDFAKRQPKRYSKALETLEKCSKKWSYERIDEDAFEKPDASAPKEAQRLADPNRLADETEQLIKTFDDGGRASRSKTHTLIQNLNIGKHSTPSPQPPKKATRSPEKKKERKRKQKTNVEPSTSEIASESVRIELKAEIEKIEDPAPVKKPKTTSQKEHVEKKSEKFDVFSKETAWKRKERESRLNSSDSEPEDDDNYKPSTPNSTRGNSCETSTSSLSDRIEGGANTRSLTKTTETASTSEVPAKKKRRSVDEVQNKEHRSKNLKQKVPSEHVGKTKEERKSSIVRDTQVVLSGARKEVLGIEQQFKKFGITTVKEFKNNRLLDEFNERKLLNSRPGYDLNMSILYRNEERTKMLLADMGPDQAMHEVCGKFSLHELLTNAYLDSIRNSVGAEEKQRRAEQNERIIRIALATLPHRILILQNKDLNTILHCAITAGNTSLVGYLLRMGSPVHIRNMYEMTAVESCIVMKNDSLLELVLRRGGSFHHILSRRVAPEFADHKKLFEFLARNEGLGEMTKILTVIENHRKNVQAACDKVRKKLIASRLKERSCGPLISFPRGNLKYSCYQQTIQFAIPENWSTEKNAKFMLVVIPVAFNDNKNIFVASSKKVALKFIPYLAGQPCKPMTKRSGMFFRATSALREHFKKTSENAFYRPIDQDLRSRPTLDDREKYVMDRNIGTCHPRLCSLSISFDQMTAFSFVVCQLIQYEPDRTTIRLKSFSSGKSYSKNVSMHREQNRFSGRPSHSEHRPSGHYSSQNKPFNRPSTSFSKR